MEKKIRSILANINEPILSKDFSTLGFVFDVNVKGDSVKLRLGITDMDYADFPGIKNKIAGKIIEEIPEIKKVDVDFMLGIVNHDNKQKDIVLPGVKNTIAIASGKGGVGKSTVAVNLAAALSLEGAKVGLIDADIYGPSIPIMLGINERPRVVQLNGVNKMLPIVQYGIKLMSIGFLVEDNSAVVWRGPMASSALKQFMSEVLWEDLDFLLFDMPPGTGDIQLTLSQTIPLTGSVVVTTPQEISLSDARKGHNMFVKVNVPNLGFIENMSYYLTPEGNKEYIFGQGGGRKISEEFKVKLLGEIPIDTEIRVTGDSGKPIMLSKPDSDSGKIIRSIAKNLILEINTRNSSPSKSAGIELIV
ncbi:MAG: iron-sulfur cluster carrier protein ApbC [Ignavibacteria bacterium]